MNMTVLKVFIHVALPEYPMLVGYFNNGYRASGIIIKKELPFYLKDKGQIRRYNLFQMYILQFDLLR